MGDILKVQPTRALSNSTRTKPRTGSIRGSCVERRTYIISPNVIVPLCKHNLPRKAISYFSSSLARQGKYGNRPNVEMPEKTESAYIYITSKVSPGPSHVTIHKTIIPEYPHLPGEYCTTIPYEVRQEVIGDGLRGPLQWRRERVGL